MLERALSALCGASSLGLDFPLILTAEQESSFKTLPTGFSGKVLPDRFLQTSPSTAMSGIIVFGIPSDFDFFIFQFMSRKGINGAESVGCPFIDARSAEIKHLLDPEREPLVLITRFARWLEGAGRNTMSPPIGRYNPSGGNSPQHDIRVMDLLMVVGKHAPLGILRRCARKRTFHLAAQLLEIRSNSRNIDRTIYWNLNAPLIGHAFEGYLYSS